MEQCDSRMGLGYQRLTLQGRYQGVCETEGFSNRSKQRSHSTEHRRIDGTTAAEVKDLGSTPIVNTLFSVSHSNFLRAGNDVDG